MAPDIPVEQQTHHDNATEQAAGRGSGDPAAALVLDAADRQYNSKHSNDQTLLASSKHSSVCLAAL
jgi:hypothetical protein